MKNSSVICNVSQNMKTPFKTDFKNSGGYCNLCYLNNLENKGYDNKKVISENRESAKNRLTKIIGCADSKEVIEIVAEALNKCEKCRFENPEIFKYLDKNKIIHSG